ncbi:hypothetical protein BZG36_04218 [Bifiguratus adelaidae]|uniref:DNA/RNA-binding protein Alba-like domain-containing protein n=1 Tax=Bifiguratus adelaidae TaxID=1938954 RepID=A0A261XYA1_9FUNG|nr:hypothetical protein BZG36_04218 [Bifiguratus adelaidae]
MKWLSLNRYKRLVTVILFIFALSSLSILFRENLKLGFNLTSADGTDIAITETSEPINACFLILVRNRELEGIISSIRQLEARFNRNFHYPYVFLNDEDFSQEFKDTVLNEVSGDVQFGKVEEDMWGYPAHINQTRAREAMRDMEKKNVPYGGSESYRHMCRFQSGFFFRLPLVQDYEYYWRVEPDVDFSCDIPYDVFRFMKTNKKKYGFTMTLYEIKETIPTLWDTVTDFRKDNSEMLMTDRATLWKFVADDNGAAYSRCHFWTNFEIASFDIWRSEAYLKFFDYLDSSGGFYYERWGDAPVHTIAASMFLAKDEIHRFDDIGYRHGTFSHCPMSPKIWHQRNCACDRRQDFDFGMRARTGCGIKVENYRREQRGDSSGSSNFRLLPPPSPNEYRVDEHAKLKKLSSDVAHQLLSGAVAHVTLTGAGVFISKAVAAAEMVKHKVNTSIHQYNQIGDVEDNVMWEPISEDLDRLKVTRHVPVLMIHLSTIKLPELEEIASYQSSSK